MEVPGGGRALNGLESPPGYQNQSNSEYRRFQYQSNQAVGDKVHCREDNSPDHQLRCLNVIKWKGCDVAQTVRMLA